MGSCTPDSEGQVGRGPTAPPVRAIQARLTQRILTRASSPEPSQLPWRARKLILRWSRRAALGQAAFPVRPHLSWELLPVGRSCSYRLKTGGDDLPPMMRAWALREVRLVYIRQAFALETVPLPALDPGEALVTAMAAGGPPEGNLCAGSDSTVAFISHSGIRCSRRRCGHRTRLPIWSVGDEVIHCIQSCWNGPECNGPDPLASSAQKIWGLRNLLAQLC